MLLSLMFCVLLSKRRIPKNGGNFDVRRWFAPQHVKKTSRFVSKGGPSNRFPFQANPRLGHPQKKTNVHPPNRNCLRTKSRHSVLKQEAILKSNLKCTPFCWGQGGQLLPGLFFPSLHSGFSHVPVKLARKRRWLKPTGEMCMYFLQSTFSLAVFPGKPSRKKHKLHWWGHRPGPPLRKKGTVKTLSRWLSEEPCSLHCALNPASATAGAVCASALVAAANARHLSAMLTPH